ncbi:hypothetical protein Pint_03334 [Pistacia integerrima]|uniref:Uncharacterized protein n=1 Tax=Pistacia integerrima TaxID=434235 RepID=A0ACC0ZQJ1_9ROSI|nr:hypothetical protein Pint_03334 [Pistacia integerrima]
MAASVDTLSPAHLNKESSGVMGTSPLCSPSSDKRFWSNLRTRVDSILEDRNRKLSDGENQVKREKIGESNRAKRLKEDSLLLLRGFDSVAYTLSQLSNNIDNALQGARDLAKPPTLTEIFHAKIKEAECKEEESREQQNQEETNKGVKRKFDPNESSEDPQKEKEPSPKDKRMKKTKNVGFFFPFSQCNALSLLSPTCF